MKRLQVLALALLGLLFVALAVYYFMTPANALLHFVPGYDPASSDPHVKHALAALLLAVGCGVLAWFSSGKKSEAPSEPAE